MEALKANSGSVEGSGVRNRGTEMKSVRRSGHLLCG